MADPNSICPQTSIHRLLKFRIIKLLLLIITLIVSTQSQCCLKFINGKCLQCPTGTRLYMGNCLFDIPNCVRYSGGFYCTKCEQGFELMDDNTCVGLYQNFNLTEADIKPDGFEELPRTQILSHQSFFNKGLTLLKTPKDNPLYTKQQIIKVYTKTIMISIHSLQIFRIIAQTKGGFDDILFYYNPLTSTSSIISKKSFNKITQTTEYVYVDLKADEMHEFIMMQISEMSEFMKGGKSVFEESEELIAYYVEKRFNNTTVNSYLIYFANKNYGLIEVGFDLEVYQKHQTTNITYSSTNNTNSTTNNTNDQRLGNSEKNNKTEMNNSSTTNNPKENNPENNNNRFDNRTFNTSQKSTSNNPLPSTPTNPNQNTSNNTITTNSSSTPEQSIVYLRSLLSLFNYTLLQNYTALPDNIFSLSPITPNVINFLVDNHPTLAKIYHKQNTFTSDYLIDASYRLLTVKELLLKLQKQGLVVQQTIEQFEKDLELDTLVAVIFRLTYEIDQLQPYQIKLLAVAKLNNNKSLDPKTNTHMDVNPSSIQFIKIVQQIGRPQNTYIDESLLPKNHSQSSNKVIAYPPEQKQFIQRVQFFLEMQYPEVMENVKLMNVTYQEFNKPLNQIKNLTAIKQSQLRKIEEKNTFRATYRVYVLIFERVEGQVKTEYKWKVQFKDNQLDLMQVPKEVAHPYSGGESSSQKTSGSSENNPDQPNSRQNNTSGNSFNNNKNQTNINNTQNANTQSNTTSNQSSNSLNQSTISSETSQQQVIFNNLFVGQFVSMTDKYIIQLDRLVKSFYSGLLNTNNIGKYSLALVGLRVKYQLNTTVAVNLITNTSSSSVSRVQEQKLFRVWYVLTKFNRPGTNSNTSGSNRQSVVINDPQVDSQKVFGFQLGVNMKGLVTLYKVNIIKRLEFAQTYYDYVNSSGKGVNGITNSTQSALKQILAKTDNLEPDLQSFKNYLQLIQTSKDTLLDPNSVNTKVQRNETYTNQTVSNTQQKRLQKQNNTKLKENIKQSVQQSSQKTQNPKINDTNNFLADEPINNKNNNNNVSRQGGSSSSISNSSVLIPKTQTNTTYPSVQGSAIAQKKTQKAQSIIPEQQSSSSSASQQQSIAPEIAEKTNPLPFEPTNPPLMIKVPSINSSFTSITQFRKWDNNFNRLMEFIQLVDPTKQTASDNDVKVIYRVQWQKSYLRYLVVFKNNTANMNTTTKMNDNTSINGTSGNRSEDSNGPGGEGRDFDYNDTMDDGSALNVFELEIERNSNNTMNVSRVQNHDDTAGEVVILSINDQTKEKQYQALIASSSITSDPDNSSNSLNNNKPALTEYYYYSKQSSKLSTSIKGASNQDTILNPNESAQQEGARNRVLQQLLNQIKAQQVILTTSKQPKTSMMNKQVKTPSVNLLLLNPIPSSQYPTSIKGQSIANKQNLRKQSPQSVSSSNASQSTIISNTSQSLKNLPTPFPTRKWLGMVQLSTLNKGEKPQEQRDSAISSFSRRFYQNKPSSNDSESNITQKSQLYRITTVLLQLPPAANNTNTTTVNTTLNSNNSTKNTTVNSSSVNSTATNKQTYPNITLTLSLHQFILSSSVNTESTTNNDNNSTSLSSSQSSFKVKSSKFLNRQKYRFGKYLPVNKRIDQYIGSFQNNKQPNQNSTSNNILNNHSSQSRFSIIMPKNITSFDPYFQASQRFVIWDNAFFLKMFTQKLVQLSFDQSKLQIQSNTVNNSTKEQQLTRLINNLESYNSANNQSIKHLAQFQSFMARNFKSIIYTVYYMIANYEKHSVDQYAITTKFNDVNKKYDVTEFKLERSTSIMQLQTLQQKPKTLDPALNCQTLSKQSKLKCLKCQDGYLLTNFYELFSTSQLRQSSPRPNSPSVCSKKILNCKYQFMETCIQCQEGYNKVDQNYLESTDTCTKSNT